MTKAAEIMNEIEATRADIRATLHEIQERVSIDSIVHRMIGPAKDGTIEFGRALGTAVRDNPIALSVTAVGLGWLMLGQRRNHLNGNGEGTAQVRRSTGTGRLDPSRPPEGAIPMPDLSASSPYAGEEGRTQADVSARAREAGEAVRARSRETVERARSWTKETAEHAKSWTRESASQASGTIRESTEAVKEAATRMGSQLRHSSERAGGYVRAHPFAVGAMAIVAGTTLALVLARGSRRTRATGNGGSATGREREPRGSEQVGTVPLMTTEGEAVATEDITRVEEQPSVATTAEPPRPGGAPDVGSDLPPQPVRPI